MHMAIAITFNWRDFRCCRLHRSTEQGFEKPTKKELLLLSMRGLSATLLIFPYLVHIESLTEQSLGHVSCIASKFSSEFCVFDVTSPAAGKVQPKFNNRTRCLKFLPDLWHTKFEQQIAGQRLYLGLSFCPLGIFVQLWTLQIDIVIPQKYRETISSFLWRWVILCRVSLITQEGRCLAAHFALWHLKYGSSLSLAVLVGPFPRTGNVF